MSKSMPVKKFKVKSSKLKVQTNTLGSFSRGFTLVELIISIAIFAILSGIVLAALDPFTQFQKANDARRKSDLTQIQKSLESYYQDYGKYPSASDYKIVGTNKDGTIGGISWGDPWTPYMNTLPKDPKSSNKYVYVVSSDNQTFYLYASLDRGGKDPQACKTDGTPCTNAPTDVTCGSGICNFGISSANTSP